MFALVCKIRHKSPPSCVRKPPILCPWATARIVICAPRGAPGPQTACAVGAPYIQLTIPLYFPHVIPLLRGYLTNISNKT